MLRGKYGYKTKKALFKDMKHCTIHCVNGVIKISPYRHEKLEAWGGGLVGEEMIRSFYLSKILQLK